MKPSRTLRLLATSQRRSLCTSTPVRWQANVCTSTIELAGHRAPPYQERFSETCMSNFGANGDKNAFLDGVTGESRTFSQVAANVEGLAHSFASMGVGRGDVIGLYTPNHVDFFAAFHGAAKLGAAVTMLNPLYTKNEVVPQLHGSRAKVLVAHPLVAEAASEAARELELLQQLVVVGDKEMHGAVTLDSLKTATGPSLPPTPANQDDLVCLPYSSGTTGLPKGTMLTHENLIVNLHQADLMEGVGWEEDDVVISPLPFFHIYAFLVSVHLAAFRAKTLVTMPRFDLEEFCSLVQRHKCTRAHLVPPIILGLGKSPVVDKYDMSSLKTIISAAAPLGAEIEAAAGRRLGCIVKQAWGMSELSPLGTCTMDQHLKPESGTVGIPAPATSVKVLDLETGEALPCGAEGELVIKGPQVMKGYLDLPDKTAECLDEEGWLKTGDIARIDEDGFVYITDRLKELIKYKGFQVAPAELEARICTHPAVADATVIPVPDEEAGEVPRACKWCPSLNVPPLLLCAWPILSSPITNQRTSALPASLFLLADVVLKPDMNCNETELQAFVAEHVAPHKKLRGGVRFVESVPKTASGKILRRVVIEMDRAAA